VNYQFFHVLNFNGLENLLEILTAYLFEDFLHFEDTRVADFYFQDKLHFYLIYKRNYNILAKKDKKIYCFHTNGTQCISFSSFFSREEIDN
jgi:hypothetical protein